MRLVGQIDGIKDEGAGMFGEIEGYRETIDVSTPAESKVVPGATKIEGSFSGPKWLASEMETKHRLTTECGECEFFVKSARSNGGKGAVYDLRFTDVPDAITERLFPSRPLSFHRALQN